jgi:hypothetical protein
MSRSGKLAILAIALWVFAVGAFAWFFVRGDTAAGTDGRNAVVLVPAQRDFILGEMRGLLSGVQAVLDGIGRGDRQGIAAAARGMGMASAADVDPVLLTKLPLSFKQLGMSVHHDMDALAEAAESGRPLPEVQAMLTGTLAKCTGCHAAWQFAVR